MLTAFSSRWHAGGGLPQAAALRVGLPSPHGVLLLNTTACAERAYLPPLIDRQDRQEHRVTPERNVILVKLGLNLPHVGTEATRRTWFDFARRLESFGLRLRLGVGAVGFARRGAKNAPAGVFAMAELPQHYSNVFDPIESLTTSRRIPAGSNWAPA